MRERKQIKLKGINRSKAAGEDGYCQELINMRHKDGSWRSVGTKRQTTIHANTPALLLAHTHLCAHPLMDTKYLIGYKPADEQLNMINTLTGTAVLVDVFPEGDGQDIVDSIFFFGRLMIVTTVRTTLTRVIDNKIIFKLNDDEVSFTLLEELPEGQHVFWQTNELKRDVTLLDDSSSPADQVAIINKTIYDDRVTGKYEGHTFFQLAWRLFDNTLIKHSALHYHHVGVNDVGLTIDSSEPTFVLRNYMANSPKMRLSFSEVEISIIEKYKGVISGLVVFMSDPKSTYNIGSDLTDWEYTAGVGYDPPIRDNISDIFKDINGMYKVDEFALGDVLSWTNISGVFKIEKTLDLNDVNNIESNELLPVDNFTNHLVKGKVSYDYNSRIHLANITTILKDCYNLGKYQLFNTGTSDDLKIKELIYGDDCVILENPLVVNPTIASDVSLSVNETDYIPILANNWRVLFNELELDPLNLYNNSTGIYTVLTGVSGVYTIHVNGTAKCNGPDLPYNVWSLHAQLCINNIAVRDKLLRVGSGLVVDYFDFEFNYTDYLIASDQVCVKIFVIHDTGYIVSTGLARILDGLFTISYLDTGSSIYTFTPYFEVDLETSDGERTTEKILSTVSAYYEGFTMYTKPGSPDLYYACLKEYITYPDTRARKLRLFARVTTGLAMSYHLIASYDLISHPYLNMSYAVPTLDSTGNRFYQPKKIILPPDITLLQSYAKATINNTVVDKNRVQVSEVNNAFLYPAKYSYRVGTMSNEVVKIATMSDPVSTGQWGDFPLNIFTSQGVFNLMQGNNDVLYASTSRLSLDVLLSRDMLLELGGMLVYATVNGLFLLSGSQRKEISIAIEGDTEGFNTKTDKWKFVDQGISPDITNEIDYFSSESFISYLQGAKMVYDHNEREVIISDSGNAYSYVYQLDFDVWHKVKETYTSFFKLSDGLQQGTDALGNLYDVTSETFTGFKTVSLLTRPLILDSRNLKKIERLATRTVFEPGEGYTTLNIFASLDGRNFIWVAGLQITEEAAKVVRHDLIVHRTHTSARYFIIAFSSIVDSLFDFDSFDLEVEYKFSGKLR